MIQLVPEDFPIFDDLKELLVEQIAKDIKNIFGEETVSVFLEFLAEFLHTEGLLLGQNGQTGGDHTQNGDFSTPLALRQRDGPTLGTVALNTALFF